MNERQPVNSDYDLANINKKDEYEKHKRKNRLYDRITHVLAFLIDTAPALILVFLIYVHFFTGPEEVIGYFKTGFAVVVGAIVMSFFKDHKFK